MTLAINTAFNSLHAQNANRNEQASISADKDKEEIEHLKTEVENLRQDMNRQTSELKNEIKDYTPIGLVLILFGGFCALWAQNTGRNPWSWFFIGLVFSIFAVIIVLLRNAEE